MVSTEHGGGGQSWDTAYRVIREVARGDGSIGQLLGYHYLWAWAARLVAAVEELYTSENYLFGGAVNPRDGDLTITDEGDEIVYNGRKSFSTGGKVSDLTVIVPSAQEGIVFHDDWDTIGPGSPNPAACRSPACVCRGRAPPATWTRNSGRSPTTR